MRIWQRIMSAFVVVVVCCVVLVSCHSLPQPGGIDFDQGSESSVSVG